MVKHASVAGIVAGKALELTPEQREQMEKLEWIPVGDATVRSYRQHLETVEDFRKLFMQDILPPEPEFKPKRLPPLKPRKI